MESDTDPRRRVVEWVRQQLAADPTMGAEWETVTRGQAAAMLAIAPARVSELVQRGRLPARQLVRGGKLHIPREAVEALAASRGAGTAEPD